MSFIQVIEIMSSKLDEMRALDEQWEKATEGKRTARRSIMTRDRNDPNRVRIMVFFDSYESAMENSNLPETQEFAAKWAELAEEPPRFLDLDVIDDRTS
jgi:quinol monooxygenase YgiN